MFSSAADLDGSTSSERGRSGTGPCICGPGSTRAQPSETVAPIGDGPVLPAKAGRAVRVGTAAATPAAQRRRQALAGSAASRRPHQTHMATPATTMGTHNHCPMLMPIDNRPRKASGSRKNSAVKRSTP